MTTIHVQLHGDQAFMPKSDLERLLELARRAGPVHLNIDRDELTTYEIMQLAASGGSFDFWTDAGEDIYSADDGEPV